MKDNLKNIMDSLRKISEKYSTVYLNIIKKNDVYSGIQHIIFNTTTNISFFIEVNIHSTIKFKNIPNQTLNNFIKDII